METPNENMNADSVVVEEEVRCPICLEDHTSDQIIVFTYCSHSLCRDCYDHFLETSNKCPVCRTKIQDEKEVIDICLTSLQEKLSSLETDIRKLKIINSKQVFTEIRNNGQQNVDLMEKMKAVQQLIANVNNGLADTGLAVQRNIPITAEIIMGLPRDSIDFIMGPPRTAFPLNPNMLPTNSLFHNRPTTSSSYGSNSSNETRRTFLENLHHRFMQ